MIRSLPGFWAFTEWWSDGVAEEWSGRIKNRGYQQLRVWQDAITLYVETCQLFKSWPFEMKRVAGQAFRMENSLLRLIEALERKRDSGAWTETLIINESSIIYTSDHPDHP